MSSIVLGWIFVTLLGLGGRPGALIQDVEPTAPTCRKCKSTGVLVCSEHPKDECALEDQVRYCSLVADCESCAGAGFVDCPKCDNEVAQERIEKRRETSARSAKVLEWVDKTWNEGRSSAHDPLRKIESEHFILVWQMEGLKVDRKRLNTHQTMHLYAERMERLYTDYCAAFGDVRSFEFSQKFTILVWNRTDFQMESSLRFCSSSAKRGVKLLGSNPRYSVCGNKQLFNSDEELHRNLVHNVAHLLLSHQSPSSWIGDKKYGWADEGLGHWFEDRYFGICTNYCYQEQNSRFDFKSGKYRLAVRKMVAADDFPSVGEVFSKTTNDLTLPEHAISFSYVDYLLGVDGKKYSQMMKLLKQKLPTRDALQKCFEMNPLQFEVKWKAWVLETYPTR